MCVLRDVWMARVAVLMRLARVGGGWEGMMVMEGVLGFGRSSVIDEVVVVVVVVIVVVICGGDWGTTLSN